MLKITSDFIDDFLGRPPRELLSYHHKLRYETDEEVVSIEIDNLPPGLVFRRGIICGNMKFLNTWHPVKDYIAKSIDGLDDNVIPFPDCYVSIQDHTPLTVKYLKDHRFEMHYTARNVTLFGAKAYVLDGNQIFHKILIKAKTKENYYEIPIDMQIGPLFSPKLYVLEYGKIVQLSSSEGKLSPSKYIVSREKEGHRFASGTEILKKENKDGDQ